MVEACNGLETKRPQSRALELLKLSAVAYFRFGQ